MNHTYTAREFNLPTELQGLSAKQIEVHLGLYKGYITHVNKLQEQVRLLSKSDDNAYAITEERRRLSFEFNGMRMHEYYFEQLEGGAQERVASSPITDKLLTQIKDVAMGRGIGWTVAYYDGVADEMVVAWVSDHELGTLAGLPIVFALDMWEHAFMVDYTPVEKAQYIDAYLSNVNWGVVAGRVQ